MNITFYQILANNLVANITNFTVWFAVTFWVFLETQSVFATGMIGVIVGNIRSIALPTLVTVLIPEDIRDKANGLVGMVTGIGFLTTSVISGFLVAWGGMFAVMI